MSTLADEAERLVGQLMTAPEAFTKRGMSYQLLQCYFGGYPVETLRLLLRSGEPLVQRAGAWISSELGCDAKCLLDDVIPILGAADQHAIYYAMDVVALCAVDEDAVKYHHLVAMLDASAAVFRQRAMELLTSATASQLAAALAYFRLVGDRLRQVGLATVIGDVSTPDRAGDLERSLEVYQAVRAARLDDVEEMKLFEASGDQAVRDFARKWLSARGHSS